MNWEKYLKLRKITLSPWQKEAADAILRILYKHQLQRGQIIGKTFLFKLLLEYVNEHGHINHPVGESSTKETQGGES
jgi:hypothetical protein